MNVKLGERFIQVSPQKMIKTCQSEYDTFQNHLKESEGLPQVKAYEIVSPAKQEYIECCKVKYIQPLLKK